MSGDELLNKKQVADALCVSSATISAWLMKRKPGFPRGFKLGTAKNAPRRWRAGVINDYIKEQERSAA